MTDNPLHNDSVKSKKAVLKGFNSIRGRFELAAAGVVDAAFGVAFGTVAALLTGEPAALGVAPLGSLFFAVPSLVLGGQTAVAAYYSLKDGDLVMGSEWLTEKLVKYCEKRAQMLESRTNKTDTPSLPAGPSGVYNPQP